MKNGAETLSYFGLWEFGKDKVGEVDLEKGKARTSVLCLVVLMFLMFDLDRVDV